MDYPSGSDDEDSDFVLEQAKEKEENDHVIDSDMELSSSDSDVSSISGNVQEDRGRYCYRLQRFHKDAFYAAYLPEWEKAKKSSHLICQEKYDEIVALLRTQRQKKEPARLLKYRSTYSLCGNVEGRCLYRNWNGKLTVVPTIENVFDVILEAHAKGGHPKGNNRHVSEKFEYFKPLC
jgi:heat shock protein HspQ